MQNVADAVRRVTGEEGLLGRVLAAALDSVEESAKFERLAIRLVEVEADEWPEEPKDARLILTVARATLSEYLSRARFATTMFDRGDEALDLPRLGSKLADVPAGERIPHLVRQLGASGRILLELVGVRGLTVAEAADGLGLGRDHAGLFLERVLEAAGLPGGRGRGHAKGCPGLAGAPGSGCEACATRLDQLTPFGRAAHVIAAASPGDVDPRVTVLPGTAGSVAGAGAGAGGRFPGRGAGAVTSAGAGAGPGQGRRTVITRAPGSGSAGTTWTGVVRGGPAGPRPGPGTDRDTDRAVRLRNLSLALLGLVLTIGWLPMRASAPNPVLSASAPVSGLPRLERSASSAPAGSVARFTLPSGRSIWVQPGQTVVSGRIGSSVLTYHDGTLVELEVSSTARVDARRLELTEGVAHLDVVAAESPFVATAAPVMLSIPEGRFVLRKLGDRPGEALALSGSARATRGEGPAAVTIRRGDQLMVDAEGNLEATESRLPYLESLLASSGERGGAPGVRVIRPALPGQPAPEVPRIRPESPRLEQVPTRVSGIGTSTGRAAGRDMGPGPDGLDPVDGGSRRGIHGYREAF